MTITPEKRPELGYIPSGSTNDFASSLGLPKNMRKAAQTAALGKPFLVDVGVFGKTGISSMWRRSEHLRRYPIRPRRRRKIFWGISIYAGSHQTPDRLKSYRMRLTWEHLGEQRELEEEFILGMVSQYDLDRRF